MSASSFLPRVLACLLVSAAVGCGSATEEGSIARSEAQVAEGADLRAAIAAINARAATEQLPLAELTEAWFRTWSADFARFGLTPKIRRSFEEGIAAGLLPSPFRFDIVQHGAPFPPRIVLLPANETIIDGAAVMLPSARAAAIACEYPVCVEPFGGTLPPRDAVPFPATVGIRVRPIEVAGTCLVGARCEGDALSIELRLTPVNVEDAVEYFGHGFDPAAVRSRALALLGESAERWVRLEAIFPGWIGAKANTYPVDGDNEVCHGPARQFFQSTLENGEMDRSTEATETILDRFYCRVEEERAPGFGDYLYVAGRHSGRFILVDPASGRWIGFSVQSGGASAFRFWWVDEDFSGRAFAHSPLPSFRSERVDVWRRCR